MGELWTCGACGRSFATTNQWHSCIELALDEHLATKSEHAVGLYRAVETALRRCGEFRIHPQKTRIAFIDRMTFAGVRLARRWADVSFVTPQPIEDVRIRRIDMYGPTSFGHELRVHEPGDIDADLRDWLCTAHRRGRQETLDSQAEVDPVVGIALERLTIPLRSRVVEGPEGRGLATPRYVVQALAAHPLVLARIGGDHYRGEIVETDHGGRLVLAERTTESLGLGLDDPVDVYLTADLGAR